jgi:hypothetical protein
MQDRQQGIRTPITITTGEIQEKVLCETLVGQTDVKSRAERDRRERLVEPVGVQDTEDWRACTNLLMKFHVIRKHLIQFERSKIVSLKLIMK